MRITWSRTVIGGRTAPYDFVAVDETGDNVGRIMKVPHGPQEGKWQWAAQGVRPGIPYPSLPPRHGIEDTRAGAIRRIIERHEMEDAILAELAERGSAEMNDDTTETPSPAPAGVWEHPCEYQGCDEWGGHGYSIAGRAPRWFCGKHKDEGEKLIGRG